MCSGGRVCKRQLKTFAVERQRRRDRSHTAARMTAQFFSQIFRHEQRVQVQRVGNEHPAMNPISIGDDLQQRLIITDRGGNLCAVHIAGRQSVHERFVFINIFAQTVGNKIGIANTQRVPLTGCRK